VHYVVNVSTAPTSEPITLAEARLHLRVTDDSEDALLESLIKSARMAAENFCNRSLMPQTLDLYLDRFPCGEAIRLPRGPVTSVTSIVYTAADGTANTTWSSANYSTDLFSEPVRIVPIPTQSYPSTYSGVNTVRVRYVAGYATAALVPTPIKQAMLMMMGHWYEARSTVLVGGISKELEFATTALLTQFQVGDEFTSYGVEGFSYA
jgi:uncharacterized phiE125 gp8 family phage protein